MSNVAAVMAPWFGGGGAVAVWLGWVGEVDLGLNYFWNLIYVWALPAPSLRRPARSASRFLWGVGHRGKGLIAIFLSRSATRIDHVYK